MDTFLWLCTQIYVITLVINTNTHTRFNKWIYNLKIKLEKAILLSSTGPILGLVGDRGQNYSRNIDKVLEMHICVWFKLNLLGNRCYCINSPTSPLFTSCNCTLISLGLRPWPGQEGPNTPIVLSCTFLRPLCFFPGQMHKTLFLQLWELAYIPSYLGTHSWQRPQNVLFCTSENGTEGKIE